MTVPEQLQVIINNKTKPLGSLGMLETLAIKIGTIQNSITPTISKPHIVVLAADHGIAATGLVNPYPQAVTAQMVLNFTAGGAAINALCNQNNIALTVVDTGVNYDFDPTLPIKHYKIAKGTTNYQHSNAMSANQVETAIANGKKIVEAIQHTGCNTIGFGEMGIGNTSSASLIMHYYLQAQLVTCVGNGTGANPQQYATKLATLQAVSEQHKLLGNSYTVKEILQKIGGYEIATMVGAYLHAAQLGMVIVVDGFIATAALLIAINMQPAVKNNCVFAHCSSEAGHRFMLHHLGVTPLLNLGLRLGEGTGAALAMPLLQCACAFVQHMASFSSAGVSEAG